MSKINNLNESFKNFKMIIKDIETGNNYENYLKIFSKYLFIKRFHSDKLYDFKTIHELRDFYKKTNIKKYNSFMDKKFNFNQLNFNDLEAFLILYRTHKASTRNFIKALLKKYVKFLLNEKIIKENIIDPNWKYEKVEEGIENRNIPTVEEFLKMLDTCETLKEKMIIQMAFGSTLRATEIVNAKIENLLWDQNAIKVYGAKKKNTKEVSYYVYGNKTKGLLKEFLKQENRDNGFIFINSKTKKKYTRQGIRYIIAEAGKRVGIKITTHSSKDFNLNMFEEYEHPKLKTLMQHGKHKRKETTLGYLRGSNHLQLAEKIKKVPFF